MNEYWEQWYEATQVLSEMPLDSDDHDLSNLQIAAGTAVLSASYVAATLLIKTKNPYAVAIGTGILLVPDPVIFGIGYVLAS